MNEELITFFREKDIVIARNDKNEPHIHSNNGTHIENEEWLYILNLIRRDLTRNVVRTLGGVKIFEEDVRIIKSRINPQIADYLHS